MRNDKDKDATFMVLKLKPVKSFTVVQQGLQINMDGKNLDGPIKFFKYYSISNIVSYPESGLQWIWRVGRDQSMCDSLGHGKKSVLYS